MEKANQSVGITFILLGFSEYPHLRAPLFLVFLAIYTVSVVGNMRLIVIITMNSNLHTPLYYFLGYLSFLDFWYSSITTPKLLEILFVEIRTISYMGYMTRFSFGCTFVIVEIFMLAVMAYNQFVAICNPLLYMVSISPKRCTLLVASTCSWGGLCSLTLSFGTLLLWF